MNADQQIANTIIEQLGGRRFAVMTGSKQFVAVDKGVAFKVGRNSCGINYVIIRLNSLDLYDVDYGFMRSGKFNGKAHTDHLYADQLQEDFTRHTGLDTRL